MSFDSLGIAPPILSALKSCGYRVPTPIQKQAIPPALEGRDILGSARTGTGKTCAFGVPILQLLAGRKAAAANPRAPRALILTPTRELALQIGENLTDYSKNLPLRNLVIFGGVGQAPQVAALRRGVDILTATPGRLMDLHGQGFVDLTRIEIFVLDEADRMLDMGFIHDVQKIIALLPAQKQTLFFSATMPPEVLELVKTLMQKPVRVAVDPVSSPVEVIRQQAYLLDRKNKTRLLAQILLEEDVKNALVFTRTKHGADKVTKELAREGVVAAAIHGNKSQTARQQALALFKKGEIRVLVATDIAARGLDIEELSHVFNYNLPEVPETYIHRIGRTGRAGHEGCAVSFCDHSEEPMLRGIEALLGSTIPRVEGHAYPMEDFAVMKRDAKGRLVHPDDQEARNAARERKGEARGNPRTGGRADDRNGARRGRGDAAPALSAAPRVSAPRPPQKTGIQQLADRATAERGPRKPMRPKGGTELPDTLPAAPDTVSTLPRRNPLAGDVIMDATARLLGTRNAAPQGSQSRGRGPQKAAAKPAAGKTAEGNKIPAVLKNAPAAPAPRDTNREGRREAERKMSPPLPLKEIKRGAPVPPQGASDAKNPTLRPAGHGNRGRRRAPPPVEAPRSHQKDSTEQPSLMKPFYIEHD